MATPADFHRIGNYARMYNPHINTPRPLNKPRSVPLEVLCLGYSRTGTLSMHSALTILGIQSPYHFSSIYDRPIDSDLWMTAINAKYNGVGPLPDKQFFDQLLGDSGGVTDIPCILFWQELLTFYPDAKVVLVQRDEEKWFTSWLNFCRSAYAKPLYFLARLDPWYLGRITAIGGAGVRILAGHATTFEAASVRSRDTYRHYYADIRAAVPKERLLEYSLKDKWEPLCEFLGREVPKGIDFPHENDAERNRRSFEELGAMAVRSIVGRVVKVGVVVGAGWFVYSRWKLHRRL